MSVATANHIVERLQSTRDLPTIPAVLLPLLRYMEKPLEQVDVHHVVSLISQDKSLAGRCLQMANSPLFGSAHEVETIQAAVVALGLDRIQQIAVSCCLLKLMPSVAFGFNPAVFWSHSLGCALVCHEFASHIAFPDVAKAYAAGLLHDIGIVALLWVAPHEFRRCFEEASRRHIPLHEAEQLVMGITHCESGRIIACNWRLPEELTQVIASHHSPGGAHFNSVLTSVVCVSDLLCRIGGLGYGYTEEKQTNFAEEPAFATLEAKYPVLRPFDLARFTFEMEYMLDEVRSMVARIYVTH